MRREMNNPLSEYAYTEVKIEEVKDDIKQITYNIRDLQAVREKLQGRFKNTRESLDELRLSVALDITRSPRHGTRASEIKHGYPE